MRSILCSAFLLLAISCSGDERTGNGEPLQIEARLSSIQPTIFDRSCANFSACHDDSSPAGDLDLTAPAAYAQLIDRPATMSPSSLRVVPGEQDLSFLVRKLKGPLEEDEGALMPFANPPLPPEEIQVIEEWIARGAAND